MEKELKIFLKKLISQLNKNYNKLNKKNNDGFYTAKAFSYYDVLDIIDQQLDVFQFDKNFVRQPIVPSLIYKKKTKSDA